MSNMNKSIFAVIRCTDGDIELVKQCESLDEAKAAMSEDFFKTIKEHGINPDDDEVGMNTTTASCCADNECNNWRIFEFK